MLNALVKELIKTLFVDYYFIKQANLIKKNLATKKKSILDISFILRESLIYHVNSEERLRLYISPALE